MDVGRAHQAGRQARRYEREGSGTWFAAALIQPRRTRPTLVGASEVTVPLPSADRQRPGSPLSRAVGGEPGAYSAAEPAVTASTTSPALVISTLRGLASSATGMVRVSTPFS